MEVFGGMFVLGAIAAANVSAGEAHAKVDPGITGFLAVFTDSKSVWSNFVDLIEVCAGFFWHKNNYS